MAPSAASGVASYQSLALEQWAPATTGLVDAGQQLPGPLSVLSTAIRAIGELCAEVERFDDFDGFLDRVALTAVAMLGYDSAMVIATDETGHAKATGSYGLSTDYLRGTRGAKRPDLESWSPVREALATGRPSLVGNVEAEPRLQYFLRYLRHQGVRACGSFPLRNGRGSVGVLTVYLREAHEFTELEADLISAVTSFAASIVDAAVLRREREYRLADQRALVHRHERSAAIAQRMMDAVLARKGLAGVATALGEMVCGPVVVEDVAGQVLARSDNVGDQHVPLSASEISHRSVGTGGWQLRKQAVIVDGNEVGTVSAMTSPLTDDRLVSTALNHCAVAAGVQLLSERGQAEPDHVAATLLADIRTLGKAADADDLLDRAENLGYRLRGGIDVLMVGSAERIPSGATRRLLKSARHRLSDLVPGALTAPSPGGIVVLLPAAATANHDVIGIAEVLAAVAADLTSPVPPYCVVAGRCAGLNQVAECLAFGESLLRLAKADRDAGKTTAQVIDGRALALNRILSVIPDPVGLIELRDQVIGPLLEYDRVHRTDLLATVECYLKHGLRAKETARELIVHVNSLSYRLRRIEEILGFDLRGGAGMLQLQFAIELNRVLRGRASSLPVLTDSA